LNRRNPLRFNFCRRNLRKPSKFDGSLDFTATGNCPVHFRVPKPPLPTNFLRQSDTCEDHFIWKTFGDTVEDISMNGAVNIFKVYVQLTFENFFAEKYSQL
jgi:hypothetical protein